MQYDTHISSGAYANNVKCLFARASGNVVNYSEFI